MGFAFYSKTHFHFQTKQQTSSSNHLIWLYLGIIFKENPFLVQ